jgi:tetratricopeptide (TPR) repeat protein
MFLFCMMRVLVVVALGWAGGARAAAVEPTGGGSPEAVKLLRDVVTAQRAALAEARKKEDASDLEDVRPKLQRVIDDYEDLVGRYGDFAAGWAAYGLFLCDPLVEDRRASLPLLLKANALDAELPVVKNQIGVILAEQGRPVDAFNYFLAASDLAPREPLYHLQIGLVLDEARADFLKTGAWSGATLDKSILEAFSRVRELLPERTDYAYRGAEAYYTLTEPRWEEAYQVWTNLEEKLASEIERQTVRLHRARVLWKQGLAGDARELLETVSEPKLAPQRALLESEFKAEDAAEAAAPAGEAAGASVPAGAKSFFTPTVLK